MRTGGHISRCTPGPLKTNAQGQSASRIHAAAVLSSHRAGRSCPRRGARPAAQPKFMHVPAPARAEPSSDASPQQTATTSAMRISRSRMDFRRPAITRHRLAPPPPKTASNKMIPQELSEIGFVRPKASFAPSTHKTAQPCTTTSHQPPPTSHGAQPRAPRYSITWPARPANIPR